MNATTKDLAGVLDALEAIRLELGRLNDRIAALEATPGASTAAAPRVAAPGAAKAAPPREEIGQEIVLVLGAAIAAFLGKKPHIRQIRLLGSAGWAQQGRVTVQASHALSSTRQGRSDR